MNQEIWRIFKFPENGHPLELGSISEDIPEPFCPIQSELSPEILIKWNVPDYVAWLKLNRY